MTNEAVPSNRRGGFPLFIAALITVAGATSAGGQPPGPQVPQDLRDRADRDGTARVIVQLRLPSGAARLEGRLANLQARRAQRLAIGQAQDGVLSRLGGRQHRLARRLRTAPFVALEVGGEALAALANDPAVERIVEDRELRPVLSESVPLIQGDLAWDFGYDGAGQVVAVVDSGVESGHPFLAGKVVSEACYAANNSCPNGASVQVGTGAGEPCEFAPSACFHGTHVAGIAAGSGALFSGVARNAQLISIQVFHASTTGCIPFFEDFPCARAFSSDVGAALERVYELRDDFPIAAVNLSLGGGSFASSCDTLEPQLTAQIENLRSAGIATVIAAGNDGYTSSIAFPACISSAIAVGATTKLDTVADFSNASPLVSVWAPGAEINSSVTGGDFFPLDGTSMAAPHVAGAFALLKQNTPLASVDDLQTQLESTGLPVTDHRVAAGVTRPRIQIASALGIELPVPVLASLDQSFVVAWSDPVTLTVTGSEFFRTSSVRVNGVSRPTVYLGHTSLRTVIPAADLATTATSLAITVFTPGPGGGTSAPLTLELRQPVLSVSETNLLARQQVTVTLTNGPGGAYAWLALAAVGAPETSFLTSTYVGAGVSTRTWTVTIDNPGAYEFRLFPFGYQRAVSSPTINVEPGPPPALAVNVTSISPGGQATVTLTNGIGGPGDWLALAPVGSPSTTYAQYAWVGTGVTTRTWTVNVPAPGNYEFRLLLNAGYAVAATSAPFTVQAPALAVSAASVTVGTPLTVTLTNGLLGGGDWLAFAVAGSSDYSYLSYTYVGAGVGTRSWTVTPSAPGNYEFRLLNNGYVRVAASPMVTVTPGPPALAVSATSVVAGGQVTVTLNNGIGGASDTLTLATQGSPDSSFVQSTPVGTGVTTRTWTVTIPSAGSYEFRLLVGGVRAATSPGINVTAPVPVIAVSATTITTGGPVTATLTHGPGTAGVLLALAEVGSPDASVLQSSEVGVGVTTRTWTVTIATPGSYEFRLFVGGTRAATSPVVVVNPGPSLAVSATSVAAGGQVSVTLANGAGGALDWLALATVGSADTSYVQYVWVGGGVTTRTWTVNLPAAGDYEFRLFLNNSYVRATTSPTVTAVPGPPPVLSVDSGTVVPGTAVTLTLTNGSGAAGDWIALAAVGSPVTSYVAYTYVGAGVTTRTWTVNTTSPGAYEFRLFSNGYTLSATSAAVTVTPPTLELSATSVAPGGSVTVTLTNGTGGAYDWLSLAAVGSPDASYITYTYVGAGVTTRTWTVALPATPGNYEIRLMYGYTRLQTSATITVSP